MLDGVRVARCGARAHVADGACKSRCFGSRSSALVCHPARCLLRIPETARGVADTWRLVQSYRLPVDSRFEAADDWSASAGWARDFEERCRANRWLEQARLSDMVARRFDDGELRRAPQRVSGGL